MSSALSSVDTTRNTEWRSAATPAPREELSTRDMLVDQALEGVPPAIQAIYNAASRNVPVSFVATKWNEKYQKFLPDFLAMESSVAIVKASPSGPRGLALLIEGISPDTFSPLHSFPTEMKIQNVVAAVFLQEKRPGDWQVQILDRDVSGVYEFYHRHADHYKRDVAIRRECCLKYRESNNQLWLATIAKIVARTDQSFALVSPGLTFSDKKQSILEHISGPQEPVRIGKQVWDEEVRRTSIQQPTILDKAGYLWETVWGTIWGK